MGHGSPRRRRPRRWPDSVTVDGVTVTLGIDPWGEIEFNVFRNDTPLADIPAKLKKDKKIAALRERKTELKRQASRIRGALEQFMCRGDTVTGTELQELMKHPLLSPMLRGLVLVGDDIAVLIKGELGEYSVHLGSAVSRRMTGEMLFIVAVQAQHRGRLFLPFADDDPRTAEVISKVLLLARDREIKDPTILDQIRR